VARSNLISARTTDRGRTESRDLGREKDQSAIIGHVEMPITVIEKGGARVGNQGAELRTNQVKDRRLASA